MGICSFSGKKIRTYCYNKSVMKLPDYDNCTVRLTHYDGLVFEGLAMHNSASYDFHEFGRDEEALQIDHWLFFRSDITELEVIDPADVSVWMSRRCHYLFPDHDRFRLIDQGAASVEFPRSDFPGALPQPEEMVRFEDRTDDFDTVYFKILRVQPSADGETVTLFIAEPE